MRTATHIGLYAGAVQQEATHMNGSPALSNSLISILYVCIASHKTGLQSPIAWIISFRIGTMNDCSGISRTGNLSVSPAMTRRQQEDRNHSSSVSMRPRRS